MARIPWDFYDPVDNVHYLLPVNPNADAAETIKKNITKKATTAPHGDVVLMEGNADPTSFPFSGVILSQAQFQSFQTWFEKSRIISITDDLGQVHRVYLTLFQPKRKISHNYPWRHDYTADSTVVG